MKFFSLLFVNFLLLATILLQTKHLILINGKCVMRGPCTPAKKIGKNEDPYMTKWFNCRDDDEPRQLEDKNDIEDFKKICAPLYKENMKVCCSSSQLRIIKYDFASAQAVLGECASCYFNFRMLWCHMACDPNQSNFIVPVEYDLRDYSNFTLLALENVKNREKTDTDESDKTFENNYDKYDYENEDKNNVEDRKKRNEDEVLENDGDEYESNHDYEQEESTKHHTSRPHQTHHSTSKLMTTLEINKQTEIIPQKQSNKREIVTKIKYFLKEEFIIQLIESCRDVKLYGSDSLQAICGATVKMCTPKQFTTNVGLTVPERPFDIYFEMESLYSDEFKINHSISYANGTVLPEETFQIKPLMPDNYKCNQTFQYGTMDFGAKCSCKSCKSSCEIYPEFQIQRNKIFKIGQADGLMLLMGLFFTLFLISFLYSIIFLSHSPKNKTTTNISRNRNMGENMFIFRLIKCFGPKKKPKFNFSNETNESPISDMVEMPTDLRKKRYLDNKYLDNMKYVGENLEDLIEDKFTKIGLFCAHYPILVLVIGFSFCFLMCLGYTNFKVEKDPIKLWSSDSSKARQNKKYFDEHFSPFYRITQLIIEPKNTINTPYLFKKDNYTANVTVLQSQFLSETYKLYEAINNIVAQCDECESINKKIKLDDICFQPLHPNNLNCATQSLFQYWQNDPNSIKKKLNENNYFTELKTCMENPFQPDCLSAFGGPIQPFMVIGGYKEENYLSANALVITYVINNFNSQNREPILKAMAWEAEVLVLLKNYTSESINIYFSTERSIEDELERETKADIKIVAISYVIMFIYLTLTLGKYSSSNIKVILIEMKIFLGLAGVTLVLLSVFSSGGFFTYLGIPATLITLEVIPFLLLAVGVDNIYVMVQTYQNDERLPEENIESQIARIVGKVGPSMLLTGTTQSCAFLISALTPMPGVRAFSLYASLAIILNFLMQITCFVVLLTFDAKREAAKRIDVAFCVKLSLNDEEEMNYRGKSLLHRFFKNCYTRILLNDYVRATIIVLFVGVFCACLGMCNKLKVGLDQKLPMPKNSYQIKYFDALQKYLSVGPPVYFVLKDGYNYTDIDSLRRLCGTPACEPNSLQSLISSASFFPNETFIAQSSVNWIDDYFEWLNSNPSFTSCCYIFKNTTNFCDIKRLTEESSKLAEDCVPCPVDRVKYDFPSKDTFLKYTNHFLHQNPSRECVKAGHAMYGNAVKLHKDEKEKTSQIGSSHFLAYHTVLSDSNDFVNAMVSAYKISESITKMLNNNSLSNTKYEVFPYSIFYVFYEQYLTIWQDATMQLILTLMAIFTCTFILLAFDLFTALIVTVLISIIIIDMVGIMFLWNIELNAISLVNLVIAIGVSVEFCSHIARAFATSNQKTRKDRATEALVTMGPPVLSGVLQSIVGIMVLAFAESQLFYVFYFKMYFSILMLGLTHGLIFLPVLLSFIGRSSNSSRKLDRISRKKINSNGNNLNGEILLTDTSCNTNASLNANQTNLSLDSSNETLNANGKKRRKSNKKYQEPNHHSNHNCNPLHKRTNGRDSPSIKSVHSNHLLLNGNENDSLSSNENQMQETNLDDLLINEIDMKNFTEEEKDEVLKNTNGDLNKNQNQKFTTKFNNFFNNKNDATKKKISFSINKILKKSKNKANTNCDQKENGNTVTSDLENDAETEFYSSKSSKNYTKINKKASNNGISSQKLKRISRQLTNGQKDFQGADNLSIISIDENAESHYNAFADKSDDNFSNTYDESKNKFLSKEVSIEHSTKNGTTFINKSNANKDKNNSDLVHFNKNGLN